MGMYLSFQYFLLVNGNWTEWSQWSVCSDSCQPGGFRQRHRSCSNPLPECGGEDCVGNSTELEACNTEAECKPFFFKYPFYTV